MLNAIGLANPGRERFLSDTLPRLRELALPLWISVGGFCAADYAETCAALTDVETIELNLSCPNVDEAADSAAEIVAACRAATPLRLFAKLSAAHPDVTEVARAVGDAGKDCGDRVACRHRDRNVDAHETRGGLILRHRADALARPGPTHEQVEGQGRRLVARCLGGEEFANISRPARYTEQARTVIQ